jgi:hypothetical protein
MQPTDEQLEQQIKVSKMLAVGFACSLITLGGLSSLVALVIGLRAKKLIQHSKVKLLASSWLGGASLLAHSV